MRLRHLVADLSLDKDMLPRAGAKIALRLARRRELIDDLRLVWKLSVRRACSVLGAVRSTYQYKSRRLPQAVLKKRNLEIAQTRARYGYRRIHVLLGREGWQVNVKRVYRLYAEECLQLRNKTPKRKVSAKLREDAVLPQRPTTCGRWTSCRISSLMADIFAF